MAPSAAADRGIWVVPALLRPAPVPQVPDPGAGGCVQLQGATLCGGVEIGELGGGVYVVVWGKANSCELLNEWKII